MDADGEHPIENIDEIMKFKKQLIIGNRKKKIELSSFYLEKFFLFYLRLKTRHVDLEFMILKHYVRLIISLKKIFM